MTRSVGRRSVLTWTMRIGLLAAALAVTGTARADGKALFQQKCAACHSIGGGKLVGPDLKGVAQKRDAAWLARWIREPDLMLASGDGTAVAMLKEYNNVPMPNLGLTEAETAAVIAYLATTSGEAPSTPTPPSSPPPISTLAEEALGQALFQGTVRFANDGPACNSCHHIKNDAVIGGGILARELTTVFSRMGGEGVRAILGGPPFPVMQAAYKGRPFTDEEIRALVGFLQRADAEHAYQRPRDYGWGLFYAGLGGTVVLFGGIALVGRRRKKESVNQTIYDRQITSE